MKQPILRWLNWYYVLILLFLLAVVIYTVSNPLPNGGPKNKVGDKVAHMQIGAFVSALELFQIDNGFYPPGTNGLNDLVVKPANATNWTHYYVDRIPLDPWGHPYRYEFPGKHNTNSFDLSSAGPDRVFGTADDIGNW